MWNTDKPHDLPRWCLDTRPAKQLFGFETREKFREAKKTVVWYRRHQNEIRDVMF